jgi:hypothetical protein
MIFWLSILVGGVFAYFAIKIGFYEMWIMLFNIVISIYLAVFLRPIIANIAPIGDTSYSSVLAMLAIAVVSFLILHGISYISLTGQFSIPFPKIFDTLGAGFLGFSAGFLIWSFASFLIAITPISQISFVKENGFGRQFQQTNIPYLCWWCNLVNNAVSSADDTHATEQMINDLLKKAEEKAQRKPPPQQNEPKEQMNPTRSGDDNSQKTRRSKSMKFHFGTSS